MGDDLAAEALEIVSSADDLAAALADLNRALERHLGVTISSLVIADRSWRTALAAPEPKGVERAVLSAWERTEPRRRRPLAVGETVLVPVTPHDGILGVARVRPVAAMDAVGERSLRLVANACSAIIRSAYLAAELSADATASTDRIFEDLVTSLDASEHPSRRALPAALEALARRFEQLSGTPTRVEVRGTPVAVADDRELALRRVACEALAATTGCRASLVLVLVSYEPHRVVVSVRDDGTALTHRVVFAIGPGQLGLARLRRVAEAVGGRLDLRNLQPHGVVVECSVPGAAA
jgi:hypothetical protein